MSESDPEPSPSAPDAELVAAETVEQLANRSIELVVSGTDEETAVAILVEQAAVNPAWLNAAAARADSLAAEVRNASIETAARWLTAAHRRAQDQVG